MGKLAIVGTVVAVIAVIVVLVVGIFALKWFSAPVRGALDARETIQADGDFRLQAYNQFFNLCASIQGHEGTILAQRSLLAATTDSDEQARVRANIAGIEGQRIRAITKYNVESAKDWTVGQFKASKLPYQLSISTKETRCLTN